MRSALRTNENCCREEANWGMENRHCHRSKPSPGHCRENQQIQLNAKGKQQTAESMTATTVELLRTCKEQVLTIQ